jgi:hypothetical protein
MRIVILGVCGVKTGRRRRFFGYFGEGELETTDLESGDGDALLSGVRAELSSASAEPYLPAGQRVTVGERWE